MIGISRLGSGSHTMGFYLAQLIGIPYDNLSFIVANNFAGLREGIRTGVFDIFLWERFTTKPYFDSGELHMVRVYSVYSVVWRL